MTIVPFGFNFLLLIIPMLTHSVLDDVVSKALSSTPSTRSETTPTTTTPATQTYLSPTCAAEVFGTTPQLLLQFPSPSQPTSSYPTTFSLPCNLPTRRPSQRDPGLKPRSIPPF